MNALARSGRAEVDLVAIGLQPLVVGFVALQFVVALVVFLWLERRRAGQLALELGPLTEPIAVPAEQPPGASTT